MNRASTVRLLRWAVLGLLAVMCGLWVAPALGVTVPEGWALKGGDILFLVTLFLLFQIASYGERHMAAGALEQLRPLVDENARLKAEVARAGREAEQVRERLEVEIRSLRLAYEELRREQLARPQSQAR
jgi:hypothetical protein